VAPACGKHFGWWAEALSREGVGYDVVDERMLASVLSPSGRYKALVLPAVTTLASIATAETIGAFVKSGGRLLATGRIPNKTRERGDDAPCAALLARLVAECARVAHLPDAGPEDIARLVAKEPRPLPDMRFEGGSSWSSVSRCGDTWRLVAFNDQATKRRLNVRFAESTPEISSWNLESGEKITEASSAADGMLHLEVGAQQVVCLSISDGGRAPSLSANCRQYHAPTLTDSRPPVVLSDGWTLEIDGRRPVPVVIDRGWEVQGYPNFAGTGIYRRRTSLPVLGEGMIWRLVLPEVRETADLWLDGVFVGKHVAGDAYFALPTSDGEVEIVLRVRNTGANRYYAGTAYWDGAPRPSGITAAPYLAPVKAANR
jgi:hypothetical protein